MYIGLQPFLGISEVTTAQRSAWNAGSFVDGFSRIEALVD